MKTTKILKLFSVIILAVITACGEMDETYKDYIGDAPIIYLQKFNSDSIKVHSGRERVKITLPATMDPRIDYALVTWSNGTYEMKVPVTYKEPTVFIIDENLPEGLYDFAITNYSNDNLFSISSTVVGETYGEVYEGYLRNRNIQKIDVDMESKDITLSFPMLSDSIIQGTELKWVENGVEVKKYFPNTADNMIVIEQFPFDNEHIGEFQYRAHVLPDKEAIDELHAQWQTYRFRIEEEVIPALYDPTEWSFTTSYPNLVEGSNGPPACLVDGNANSFFSTRKPGKGNDGAGNPIPEDAESSFTIDLQEKTLFDYIEWYHRGNDTQLGLRVWGIAIYGSEDGINFTQIGDDINIPGENDSSTMRATLSFQESSYRYLKVRFTRWSTTANTAMQVGEFKLGYSKTATGKGVGVQIF